MKRILVTGGAGFLGSHLCDRLLADGNDVICLDNLFIGSKDNIRHILSNPNFEFNYIALVNTNASYLKLIEATDGKVFDFRKINSAWERTNESEKVSWLRKRMWMQNFHDNVFEIVFTVPAANISDIAYLEKNTKAFLDAVVLNDNAVIRQVKPHAVIKTVNSSVLLPREVENDKKSIALRYAVYGFIAGVFLSVAVLLGIPLFRAAQEQ